MTLNDAFTEFMNSEVFKAVVKMNDGLGSKYRVYRLRFNKGELKTGAICELLIANGYEIKANRAIKKKAVKQL